MNVLKQFSTMGMGGKPAWASNAKNHAPGTGRADGQYGANASPQGNAWGQQFMQQYGSPPGQMRPQWQAFKQQNGIGGGSPGGGGGAAAMFQPMMDWRQQMMGWRQARPQRPEGGWPSRPLKQETMTSWLDQRPQFPMNELSGAFGGQHPWLQALLNRIR
jgi:hypothetical protein